MVGKAIYTKFGADVDSFNWGSNALLPYIPHPREYGNTTGATIPLALGDAVAEGRLKKGDLVLLSSVGAGFTVGSVLLRWSF